MATIRVRSVTAPDIRVGHPRAPPSPSRSTFFAQQPFPFLANPDLALSTAASTAPYTFGAPQFNRAPAGPRRGPPGQHKSASRKSNSESRQRRGLAKLLVQDAAKNSRKSGHMSCEGCRVRKLRCSRQRNCVACVERGEPCVWKGGRPASGLTPHDVRNGILTARRELVRLERLARLLTARYVKREAVLAAAAEREPRRPPTLDDVIEAERVDEAASEGRAIEEAEALLSLGTPTVGRAGEDERDGRDEGYGGGMSDILVDDFFVDDMPSSSSSSRLDNFQHAAASGRTSSSSSRLGAPRSKSTSHTHGATFVPRLRVTIPPSSSAAPGRTGPLSSARSLLQQTPHAPSPLRYPPLVAHSSASPPPAHAPAPAPGPAAPSPQRRSPALADAAEAVPSSAPPAHPSFPLGPPPSNAAAAPLEPGPTYFYPALPPPLMSPTSSSHLAATRAASLVMRDNPAMLAARKSAHEKQWEGAVRRLEERRRREMRGEKGDEDEGKGRKEVERGTREWEAGGRGTGKVPMDVDDTPTAGGTTSPYGIVAQDPPSAPAPQRSPGALSHAAKDLVASAINRQQALRAPLPRSTPNSPSHPSLSSFPALGLSQRPILSLDAQGAFSASALHHHALLRTPSAHVHLGAHEPRAHGPSSSTPNSASAPGSTLLFGSRITLSPLRSAAPHLSAVEEGLRPINSLLGALAAEALGVDERFEPRTERARGLILGALDEGGEGTRDEWDRFEPQLEERAEQAGRMEVDVPVREGEAKGDGGGSGSDAETETDGRSSVGRASRRSARSAVDFEEEDDDEESQSGESDDGSE